MNKCKHTFEHKIIKGKCHQEGCGDVHPEHEWLAHVCKKCGLKIVSGRIK